MMFGNTSRRDRAREIKLRRRRKLARQVLRRSRLEALEDRRLLATVDVIGNVLTFNNDGVEENNLTISLDTSGNLVLQEQGNVIDGGIGVNDLSSDPLTVVIPANDFATVDTLQINTHSGDDVLSIDNSNGLIPAIITYNGDDGFDSLTLYGSTSANTTYNQVPVSMPVWSCRATVQRRNGSTFTDSNHSKFSRRSAATIF